jgi:hypothetical protein
VIFGGAYSTFRREVTVVIGGDILVGYEGRAKKGGKVGGGFVI